ncbi:MAG: hypothetical protein AAF634_10750 [Bacteroidota bacterium]
MASCNDDDDGNGTTPPPEPGLDQSIRFSLIDPVGDSLVVRNFGTSEIDISGYQLCLGPNQYNAISNYSDIVGDLSLSSNETVTLKLGSGTQNVTALPEENGGLGLFASADDFSSSDPELLLDYVQWGAANQNRVDQAVTAGRWDDAANFISGFPPYAFAGASDALGASSWQTLDPEDAQLRTGFIVIGSTPNNDFVAEYFSEMPSGTADLTDGEVFPSFGVRNVFQSYLYNNRSTDGTAGIARIKVDGNGEIVEDAVLPLTEGVNSIEIANATTGLFATSVTPAQIGVFNPISMELEGQIPMSDADLPGPQRLRSLLLRGDEVFASVQTADPDNVPYTSSYAQSADYQTGQLTATGEFPGLGSLFLNAGGVDENGNVYFFALASPPATTASTILRIPAGSNTFDPDYEFVPAIAVNPQNILLPFSNRFNYVGNNIAVALAVTVIPQSVLDIIASVGGNPANLTPQQLQQIQIILFTEEVGQWISINLETQEAEVIQGIPRIGGFEEVFSVVIGDEVYMSVRRASENAIYRYNPATGTAEKAFDVVGGGGVIGLVDLSQQ